MDAITFYQGLLESSGLIINEQGEVTVSREGEVYPVQVSNKILTLPTQKNLTSGANFWETHVAFHPVSQSLIRKESAVFKKLRQIINLRIYTNLVTLMEVLADVCAGKINSDNLTPEQLRFTANIAKEGNVNDKTIASLNKMLNVITPNDSNRLVNIYIRKGKIGNDSFSRIADVTFPIFDEYEGSKPKLFDVGINSAASYKAILAIFEYIFPDSRVPQAYSRGSCDLTAPNLQSLLEAYGNIAEKLNVAVFAFRNIIPNHESLMMDLEWMSGLENLSQYRLAIPAQPGNEGDPLDDAGSNLAPASGSTETMSSSMSAPAKTAAPQPVVPVETAAAAPVVPATAATPAPVAEEKPKARPTLGFPINGAGLKVGGSSSPFRKPVAEEASSSTPLRVTPNTNNADAYNAAIALQHEREKMELMASQNAGFNNSFSTGNTWQQPTWQTQGQPNANWAAPQQQQPTGPSQSYMNLMNALQQYNTQGLQLVQNTPELNNILMMSANACDAVMRDINVLYNPQALRQIAGQNQPNGNWGMPNVGGFHSPEQIAMSTGMSPGRQKAQQQKQQRAHELQLKQQQEWQQQQYRNSMMQNVNWNTPTNNNNAPSFASPQSSSQFGTSWG